MHTYKIYNKQGLTFNCPVILVATILADDHAMLGGTMHAGPPQRSVHSGK